jgi:hypothetical protein
VRKAERQGEENNSIASTRGRKIQVVQLLLAGLVSKLNEEVHIMAIFNNFVAATLEFQ